MRNAAGKFLTAETFGNKIVCAAGVMKKKQIWFLESNTTGVSDDDTHSGGNVFIRSHLGKYLTVDGDGKFLGNGEGKGEEQAFQIEAQPDGRWAFKSAKYGWYAGGSGENLTAFTKEIAEDRLWTIKLAMHPMITVKNVKRKAYIHLSDDGGALTTDEVIPWGDDAVLSVVFFDAESTYGLQACNGGYMTASGALCMGEPTDDAHFILEFNGGVVSFKSRKTGKYVTSLGASGLCKATKGGVTNDERYQFENSYPQMTLRSNNGQLLSIRQGIEIAASIKTAATDAETFQFEPLGGSKFRIKCNTDKLLGACDGGVHASLPVTDESADTTFDVEFYGGAIALKASNGKYVSQQMNGYLKCSADDASVEAKSLFEFTLVNRPRLVLRGEYGFIGTMATGLLECNKSQPQQFNLETKDGLIAISSEGKYFKVGEIGISCSSASPEYYQVELTQNSKLAIKHNGSYFQSAQNGALTASGAALDTYTLFEY
jgi:fascin 1/2